MNSRTINTQSLISNSRTLNPSEGITNRADSGPTGPYNLRIRNQNTQSPILKSKTINNKSKKVKKKLKMNNRNQVRVTTKHNPKEIIDIRNAPDQGGRRGAGTPSTPQEGTQMNNQNSTMDKERTWSIEIIGEVDRSNKDSNDLSMTRDEEETRQDIGEERDTETETDIDMNDLVLINKIYRKYVRNPKEPEVGGEDIDLEVLLVNSLKINAGKIQEITDSFLQDKDHISISRAARYLRGAPPPGQRQTIFF